MNDSWEVNERRFRRRLMLVCTTVLVVITAVIYGLCVASGRNVDGGIACAPAKAKEMGFELAGYTGYNLNVVLGGMAWYNLRKVPDNGILYEAAFSPWKGTCMVYSLRALDAIKP